MAEGDNNSVYQLVRAGGAGQGLAAARACRGRRGSQACPAPPRPALTAAVAGEGRLGPALCDAVWPPEGSVWDRLGARRGRAWGGRCGCRPGARDWRLRRCSRAGAPTGAWRYPMCGVTPSVSVCLSVSVCV